MLLRDAAFDSLGGVLHFKAESYAEKTYRTHHRIRNAIKRDKAATATAAGAITRNLTGSGSSFGPQYGFKDAIKLADRLAMDYQNDRHDGKNHNDNQCTIDGHSARPQFPEAVASNENGAAA